MQNMLTKYPETALIKCLTTVKYNGSFYKIVRKVQKGDWKSLSFYLDDAMIAAETVYFIQEDRNAQLYEPGKACI